MINVILGITNIAVLGLGAKQLIFVEAVSDIAIIFCA
jgi:hypothetical protein